MNVCCFVSYRRYHSICHFLYWSYGLFLPFTKNAIHLRNILITQMHWSFKSKSGQHVFVFHFHGMWSVCIQLFCQKIHIILAVYQRSKLKPDINYLQNTNSLFRIHMSSTQWVHKCYLQFISAYLSWEG